MTEAESAADSLARYTHAIAAQRMRLVVAGDAFAREHEPVDLMTLRAVGGAGERSEIMLTLKGIRYAAENGTC